MAPAIQYHKADIITTLYGFLTSQTGIVKKLDALSPESAPHGFYIGFKYAEPLYTSALQKMELDGVQRAVLFPQFPQYSCPTTGSNINNVYRHYLKQLSDGPNNTGLVRIL